MKITLREFRQIVREELTKHNAGRLKSVVQSALRVATNYIENVKLGNRKDGTTIRDVLTVSSEVETMAKWLKGRGEKDAEAAHQIAELLKEFEKTTDPFKRLFGSKSNAAKKLEPLLAKMHKLAYENWRILMYDEKYQNFDDDNVQNKYVPR